MMPDPWVHRNKGAVHRIEVHLDNGIMRKTERRVVYFRTFHGHVSEMCLGERYVSDAPGRYFDHECWVGSYIDNWHGGIQTGSLLKAVEWVARAEHPEWHFNLWMIRTYP